MTKKLFQILSIIALSFTFCLFFIPLSQAADDPPCTNGDCPPDDPPCTNGDCPPDDPPCTNGDCPPDDPPCTNGDCPPDQETISCNDDSGSFLAPFNRPLYFKGKKTNRNLPLKLRCVDEFGIEVDDEYMASNGWAPPVVDVAFLASGGSADPGFEADLLPGGLATVGNQFIYNGEYWILVLGLKAYTAAGVYTISAEPGDGNYTMDVSETYEKLD